MSYIPVYENIKDCFQQLAYISVCGFKIKVDNICTQKTTCPDNLSCAFHWLIWYDNWVGVKVEVNLSGITQLPPQVHKNGVHNTHTQSH